MKLPRRILPLAVAALLVTGCNVADLLAGDEEAPVEETTVEVGDEGLAEPAEETAPSGDDDGEPSTPGEDGEVEPDAESALDSGGGNDRSTGSSNTPQDAELDLTQRHPGGTVLSVSGMRFEGNTILVTGEIINGATRDIRIRVSGGARLRLKDDRGNAYNFVVPDGMGDDMEIAQGESIGGDFAFLGPIDREATELIIVANQYSPADVPLDPAILYDGTRTPEFALEGLELEW